MTPVAQHIPWTAADLRAADISAEDDRLVEQVLLEAMQQGELAYDDDVLEGRVFPLVW